MRFTEALAASDRSENHRCEDLHTVRSLLVEVIDIRITCAGGCFSGMTKQGSDMYADGKRVRAEPSHWINYSAGIIARYQHTY